MGASIYPAPGTPKPIQRGTVSVGSGASVDVTIASVNTQKAEVAHSGAFSSSAAGAAVNMVLINATTLRINNSSGASTVVASWQVKEWY